MLDAFRNKIQDRSAVVGIVGLGYVGLPLALEFLGKGFRVVGFDVDAAKVQMLSAGRTYIRHIAAERVAAAAATGRFSPTTDFSRASECDAVAICVPTPLTHHREPDMTYIERTAEALAPHVRRGQLYSLESTTWPGTTEEVLRPPLERGGLKAGVDFFLAFSPEREDPNNRQYTTATIPKVVGGADPDSLAAAQCFYDAIVCRTVPVSSLATAEATKLMENIFRCVNIALVNELKVVFDRMGIDIWEVVNAAKTKPFGYMPFYPGPGLGGHCIPIDPFYLTWRAREFDCFTRFIELAGEINTQMPYYVVEKTIEALDSRGRTLRGSRVLLLGLAYKKNVDDIRESPAFKLWKLFEARGAKVEYHDPYCPVVSDTREYKQYAGKASVPLDAVGSFDVVVVATDHDCVDYAAVARAAALVVDTRNVVPPGANVVKA